MVLVFVFHGGSQALSNEVTISILVFADGKAGIQDGEVACLRFLKNPWNWNTTPEFPFSPFNFRQLFSTMSLSMLQ